LVKKKFIEIIRDIAKERQVNYSDEVINETADQLLYLAGVKWETGEDGITLMFDGYPMGDYIRNVLSENLKIPVSVSRSSQWFYDIRDHINELRWTPIESLWTGVGQSVTRITPIAVARYVSSLVNGGIVYEAHVVDKVMRQDGTVLFDQQPVVFDTLGAPDDYLTAIMKGMAEVVSEEDGGTAGKYFKDFEYADEVGGKTGTAEVSEIDLENNSWFVCFAPYDEEDPSVKPEIAVVVYVPHGWSGGLSSLVAQDIVKYYLDDRKLVAEQNIPAVNSILPENNLLVPAVDDEEPVEG
jgi:penicillin-binding protein 2